MIYGGNSPKKRDLKIPFHLTLCTTSFAKFKVWFHFNNLNIVEDLYDATYIFVV
jgi:hypothetical protein